MFFFLIIKTTVTFVVEMLKIFQISVQLLIKKEKENDVLEEGQRIRGQNIIKTTKMRVQV